MNVRLKLVENLHKLVILISFIIFSFILSLYLNFNQFTFFKVLKFMIKLIILYYYSILANHSNFTHLNLNFNLIFYFLMLLISFFIAFVSMLNLVHIFYAHKFLS